MNKITLLIQGALIPIVFGVVGLIVLNLFQDNQVWVAENRLVLDEAISPDSTHKIAGYYYDEGALGYTAVQVSLVEIGEDYPIMGNVLKSQNYDNIEWISSDTAVVHLRESASFNSEIIVTVKIK